MFNEQALTREERYQLAVARQEIEYLRRLYGQATDALGNTADDSARHWGREIFHRIFTPDVAVRVTGSSRPLSGTGPDSWADVVAGALAPYETTQHLIGTQLVEFQDARFEDGELVAGNAGLSSYLQAWHAWPDRKVRIVLGTYRDQVRFVAGVGWQIYDMTLEHTSAEHRMLGDLS